jgi:hypothetical protein
MEQLQLLDSGRSGVRGDARGDSDLPAWLRRRPGAAAVARDSGHRPAPAVPLLSIGHNPTQIDDKPVPKPKAAPRRVVRIWKGAARADFPGIPNLDPNASRTQANGATRGKVLTFSRASRRNLSRQLATILVEPQAHTMALTLPGKFDHLSTELVKRCFRRLCDQFAAKASRDDVFRKVGFYWKQELQKREALHFHLLLYGIEGGKNSPIRAWIVRTWNLLICSHPETAPGDKEKHRWFHDRDENFQPVKDMHNYFAKYLGKAEMDLIAKEPIPGRWWGVCNRKGIPYASCSELPVPERFAIICQRITRRIQRERINEAHHRAVMKQIGMLDLNGKPLVSRFGMLRANDRWIPKHVEIGQCYSTIELARLLAHAANHLAAVHRDFNGVLDPLRIGKIKSTRRATHAGASLLGKHTPSLGTSILKFAADHYRNFLENRPF